MFDQAKQFLKEMGQPIDQDALRRILMDESQVSMECLRGWCGRAADVGIRFRRVLGGFGMCLFLRCLVRVL